MNAAVHYAQTRWGATSARVCITRAHIAPGGHYAVWVGAEAPDRRAWVQAGLVSYGDGRPQVYAETGSPSVAVVLGRVPWGGCVDVGLLRSSGGVWRVTVNGKTVGGIAERIPVAASCSTIETSGAGTAGEGTIS